MQEVRNPRKTLKKNKAVALLRKAYREFSDAFFLMNDEDATSPPWSPSYTYWYNANVANFPLWWFDFIRPVRVEECNITEADK